MTRRQRRLAAVLTLLLGLAGATALTLQAFRQNLMNFYTPSDLLSAPLPPGTPLRLGGLVEVGSVVRGADLAVDFVMADCAHRVAVRFRGILPDLFREGQGIVATGETAADGSFVASEVLAKHDENYMPPQVADALKQPGGHSCEPFKPVYPQASPNGS